MTERRIFWFFGVFCGALIGSRCEHGAWLLLAVGLACMPLQLAVDYFCDRLSTSRSKRLRDSKPFRV